MWNQHCISISIIHTDCTSWVSRSTVRKTLSRFRAEGNMGMPKSSDMSCVTKLFSNSDTRGLWPSPTADTLEVSYRLEIWQFLAATEGQSSRHFIPARRGWYLLIRKSSCVLGCPLHCVEVLEGGWEEKGSHSVPRGKHFPPRLWLKADTHKHSFVNTVIVSVVDSFSLCNHITLFPSHWLWPSLSTKCNIIKKKFTTWTFIHIFYCLYFHLCCF